MIGLQLNSDTYQSSTCNYGCNGNHRLNSCQTKCFSNGLKANLKTKNDVSQKRQDR